MKKHCRRHDEVTTRRVVARRSSLGQYLMYSSRKSTPFTEPDLAVAVLMATGLRVGEVLRIKHCDLMDDEHVYIRPFKRGHAKTVAMPAFIVRQMIEVNKNLELVFTIPYKRVYDHCKRNIDIESFILGPKNYSVTHSFRKQKIRDFLLLFHNPIEMIVNYFGWKKKESVAYYL